MLSLPKLFILGALTLARGSWHCYRLIRGRSPSPTQQPQTLAIHLALILLFVVFLNYDIQL